ncbi:MAG: response regulator [Desulfobacteraceae bacterium]|jgi:signal transduction histidine kinase/CheY-like chemotaxis protein
MSSNTDAMKEIREEQLTCVIKSLVYIGFVLLIISLARTIFQGWHNFMIVHIAAYLSIVGIAVFRQYLPQTSKTTFLISIIFILSLTGLSSLGLLGHGIGGLLVFSILSTVFWGRRVGIIAVIISAAAISFLGFAVTRGIITFHPDVIEYLTSPGSWVTSVIGMLAITGLIVMLISTINNQLISLVQDLNKQNNKLLEANKELEKALKEQSNLKTGLEQAQKMELVGIIAGGVVHDLNNVLAASINYPELLLASLPKDNKIRAPLETIKKSGLKAAAIAQDLLTLSRRRVATKEVLNLNEIITECIISPEVERIMTFHPKANVQLDLEEYNWNMDGYPLHLSKTLTNLISNAAESMPDGGNIKIKTSNKKVSGDNSGCKEIKPGEYVVLSVSDEGEGISEEDKERIFEPFYTKKEMGRSGTGLGMTVVLNTVEDHNGHIVLDSEKNRGTTFHLYFPKTEKTLPLKKDKPPATLQPGKGESILVVDDVKEQRNIASSILSMLGYLVSTKANGEEALKFIKKQHADLVILDMVMPMGMDGLDTYKKILELRPEQKVIILSGFSETERIKKALDLGAGTYIKKPYLMETIAYAVREELDKKLPEKKSNH